MYLYFTLTKHVFCLFVFFFWGGCRLEWSQLYNDTKLFNVALAKKDIASVLLIGNIKFIDTLNVQLLQL